LSALNSQEIKHLGEAPAEIEEQTSPGLTNCSIQLLIIVKSYKLNCLFERQM
jgi:hypothetical protein